MSMWGKFHFGRRKKEEGGKTARVRIIVLDDENESISLVTRLKRLAATHRVTLDLANGYLLFCGSWSKNAEETITILEGLLEAYEFAPSKQDMSPQRPPDILEMTGERLGPLRRTLTDAAHIFEPMQDLQLTAENWAPFRLVCRPS
jgi:hypothetical protein